MSADELYEAILAHRQAPQDARIPTLIWWAQRFAELGLMPSYGPGDHGNLSCRTPSGLLITARQTAKATIGPEGIVEVFGMEATHDIPRLRCRGLLLPSTDALLHFRLYQSRPDIQAVFHGHDPNTLAQAHELRVPMTETSAVVSSLALIEEACQLALQTNYVLLRDHGFLALGRTLDEAGELARTWCARARSL